MGSSHKGRLLARGVARTVERIDGLGQAFRIVVKKDGSSAHFTVEAETLRPASEAQLASLSAKLLDALADEMDDVVHEMVVGPNERLTLRVVQPGTLPRSLTTGRVRPMVASRCKLN